MSPRVSVIMPAYQASWCIGSAASSVLWQSYKDLELIVVDDGSTDGTVELVSALEGPVRVVGQPHLGVAAARKAGIDAAGGELITFCDADDVLFASHVQALVDIYEAKGGIVTANSYWLLPGGIDRRRLRHKGRFPRPQEQRSAILEQNFVSIMSLFERSLVDRIGSFDSGLARAEDWDFWIRAILGGERVWHQPKPLSLCRWGTEGLSSAIDRMDADVHRVLERVAERDDLSAEERGYVRARLAGENHRDMLRQADDHVRAGRYGRAAAAYRRAAVMFPSERPLVWKSRLMTLAPPLVGRALRARQARIETGLGMDERHTR